MRARRSAAGEPGGRQRDLDVLGRGQRRDQVELLEDEPERPQAQLRKLALRSPRRGRGPRTGRGPAVGRSSAPSSCSRVDLPEPLGPATTTNSPAPISRSTPSSARTATPARPVVARHPRAGRWTRAGGPAPGRGVRTACRPSDSGRSTSLDAAQGLGRAQARRRGCRRRRPATRPPSSASPIASSSSCGVDRRAEGDRARALGDLAPGPPGPNGTGPAAAAAPALAVSEIPSAPTSAAPPTPISAPQAPPSRPWATDSPLTWRTTRQRRQPSAFSVPSSRVRLLTEARVSRLAIRNAAARATIARAVPSLSERLRASTSEPETRSVRSLRGRHLRAGEVGLDPRCVASTASTSVARGPRARSPARCGRRASAGSPAACRCPTRRRRAAP